MSPHGKVIALYALTQIGKPYVFGAEVDLDDPDPRAFDCSELVQWSIRRAGPVVAPDGAWVQQHWCYREGMSPAMASAHVTPGLLLFRLRDRQGNPIPPSYVGPRPHVSHVGITTGDGRVVEALNPRTGVRVGPFNHTLWTACFGVPQFDYRPMSTPVDGDESGDDDVKTIYVQHDGAIWRRIGNVTTWVDQPTWDYESSLAEFLGTPIEVITDPDLAKIALQGTLNVQTGQPFTF